MINKQLINLSSPASSGGEEGLILHLDANDVDSYDGNGSEWVDITDHEYTPTTNVSKHFNTVTYTGNGTGQSITSLDFQPDLVWIKNRTDIEHHTLFDSLNGADYTNYVNLAIGQGVNEAFASFDSNGFTLDTNHNRQNALNDEYVAWCLKAGGAPSGSDKVSIDGTSYATMSAAELTDGTEPIDKLSVNTKLGFSIVKYTAPALTADTVAHGLGESPEMIILKSTSEARNWNVFHKGVGPSKNLHLNTTDSANTGEYWTASSSTFSIQDLTASADWIAYCFASKRGVSKVGSYIGTGATNKVYTGFEPAFIIGKCSSADVTNWWIFDNKRGDEVLYPNLDNSEDLLSNYVSFDRDGFTLSNAAFVNQSGRTFVYYAVAKNTNEASLIPDTDLELHLDAASFPEYGEAGYFPTPFTWIDSSVNGNNGTINFATFNSELGNWLDFDGVGSYVQTSYSPTGLNSITAEYWVNADAVGPIESFATVFFNGGGRIDFLINSNSNNIPSASSNVIQLNKTDFIGNWNQVTIVLTGLAPTYNTSGTYATAITASIYYNGEFINTVNPLPYQTPVLGARLGRSGGGYYFDGKIGQARIYSSALTQDQIRQNFNFTKPSYPNGYDGAITGAVWNAGGYFDFDGSNNYITLPFNTTFSEFSFHAWVNPDSTIGDYHAILGKWWDGSNRSFFLTGLNQILKVDLAYSDSNTDNIFGSTALPDATWSFVCVTWKNYEGLTLTVNDTTETFSINKAIRSNTNSWYIGNQDSRIVKQWDGKISQCKMYDKKLSPTEITAAYNATKSAYGL